MTPQRPTITSDMILEAAKIIGAEIDADAETIADNYSHSMTGLQLARALDRNAGWEIGEEIQEAELDSLDSMAHEVDRILERHCREWFEQNNIQPPLPIGTRVSFHWFRKRANGVITDIYEHGVGKYLVKYDACDDDNRRAIVKFEDVEPLEE